MRYLKLKRLEGCKEMAGERRGKRHRIKAGILAAFEAVV